MGPKRIHIDDGVSIYQRHLKWWIDVRRNGTRKQWSLRTENQTRAKILAREFSADILSGRWNVALAGSTTFERAVAVYRDEYESLHHASKTREYTRSLFGRIRGFLITRHRVSPTLDQVTREDIEAYKSYRIQQKSMKGTTYSPASVNRDLNELGALWNWARGKGLTRLNPVKGVKRLRLVKRIKSTLRSEELLDLIPHLSLTMQDLVRLIVNTGLRFGEASHLRSGDVDLPGRELIVRSRPDYLIKDREERPIMLNDDALQVLRKRVLSGGSRDALIFPTKSGTVISSRNALRDLKKAGGKIGRPDVNWYLLRHTFATVNAIAIPQLALQKMMGHGDPRTTATYYVHELKVLPTSPMRKS